MYRISYTCSICSFRRTRMILFKDDWNYYPSAIIDTDTKNTSFLRIATLLRDMGIENHAFPLALVNPALVGVDPHSLELTKTQMELISLECKINPWYFFREVLRAPGKAGNISNPVRANRGVIGAIWLFFNNITHYLIQPRQTGKTFISSAIDVYLLNIRCSNTQINLLTKDETLRQNTLKDIKTIDEELPGYLRQRTKLDFANTERISIKRLKNEYRAHVPQASPKAANNQGRGLTSPIFKIDEAPFQRNIAISLPAALAAGGAARDEARRNGEPYCTVFTTTSGKMDDEDGSYIYKRLCAAAEFTEKFYDCKDKEELETVIRNSSKSRVDESKELGLKGGVCEVNCTFNHKQLGFTDDWLRQKLEESGAMGETADRDYFNIWTAGSQRSPLPLDLMAKIRNSRKEPVYVEIDSSGYTTRWYIPQSQIEARMASSSFILSSDTSDASGGDDISLIITDIRNLDTVAAGTYNQTNLIEFGRWLASWFIRFPTITGIIERRSSGSHILDHLIDILASKGIDPFKRLYNRVVNEAKEEPARYKEILTPITRRDPRLLEKYKKCFGFATSGQGYASRNELYSTTLQNAAKYGGDKVSDSTTINQILSLTIENGRVDHPIGGHDDMVIAWLLCYWILTRGKNLNNYGIDSKSIMIDIIDEEPTDIKTKVDNDEQTYLRSKINDYIEELKNEHDPIIVMKIEAQIKKLSNRLIYTDKEIVSVDEMLNKLRQDKITNKQHNRLIKRNENFTRLPSSGVGFTNSFM